MLFLSVSRSKHPFGGFVIIFPSFIGQESAFDKNYIKHLDKYHFRKERDIAAGVGHPTLHRIGWGLPPSPLFFQVGGTLPPMDFGRFGPDTFKLRGKTAWLLFRTG